jgi:hypothetical protein
MAASCTGIPRKQATGINAVDNRGDLSESHTTLMSCGSDFMDDADPVYADYLRFHGPRFEYVVAQLARFVRPGHRLLDIGRSRLTDLLAERLQVPVDALGFDADGSIPTGRYYHFDLNDCQWPARWRCDLPSYDAIVFAEVLEHLHTSPALLNPGAILLVQTPNAVALPRRAAMLFGRNPYERIREDATNPGHFREYTAQELQDYVNGVGLNVELIEQRSYFDYRFAHHGQRRSRRQAWAAQLKNVLYPWLPANWRPGLTCIARKPVGQRRAA